MNGCGRRLAFFWITSLVMASAPQMAGARSDDAAISRLGGDLFMAGRDLRVTETIPGDAILAGGRVATSGEIQGDQVAAGGQLDLTANVDGGTYATGGRVRLDGKVAHNSRIAGGEVEVGPQADIQGGLTIAGGRVEVNGRVGKYLQVGAGRARIDGHIGGDVDVASGELNVGPGAVIDGILTYYGPHPATVADGAQIKGGLQYVERQHRVPARHTTMLGFGAGAWLWLIGWMVAGSVLLSLWPGFARSVTDTELRHPGMALLIGFVVLVCVPVAVILLMISLVGIPLALLVMFLYLIVLPLGYLASAGAIGDWLLSRMRRGREIFTRQRIWMLLSVLLALFLLARVPVLGGIVRFMVVLVGVGGLVLASVARQRAA